MSEGAKRYVRQAACQVPCVQNAVQIAGKGIIYLSGLVLVIVVAGFSAAATFGGVAIFRRWLENRGILDIPNERSSHIVPMPRGGGVVIVIVTLSCGLYLAETLKPSISNRDFFHYVIGALLIAAVSWTDDLHPLPLWTRFLFQTMGALVAVMGLEYWDRIYFPIIGTPCPGWVGRIITIIWIVGYTNVHNFMDGSDGIAGGQAAVAGLGWGMIGWAFGLPLVSGMGFTVAGASVGFLIHNWHPARIFMGDVGSAFLGYTLATLPLIYRSRSGVEAVVPLVGVALVWPFLFDTAFTFMRRFIHHENVFIAHRSHLYQRLLLIGFSHRSVALLYISLALIGGIIGIYWEMSLRVHLVFTLASCTCLCLFLWAFVVIQEYKSRSRQGHL